MDENDFEVENIPDKDSVYSWVHRSLLRNKAPEYWKTAVPNTVFRPKDGKISADWSNYSTPEKSRLNASEPQLNGVIGTIVRSIRKIAPLVVLHSPRLGRRSHCDIIGFPKRSDDLKEIRVYLSRAFEWKITLEPEDSLS